MREKQAPQQEPDATALAELQLDFAQTALNYRKCASPEGRSALLDQINTILDRHTELEAAIGIAALSEALR